MMTVRQVHEVFRKIANGERKHGSFLTAFAMALMLADDENENLMQSGAILLIKKYQLESYAVVGEVDRPLIGMSTDSQGEGDKHS